MWTYSRRIFQKEIILLHHHPKSTFCFPASNYLVLLLFICWSRYLFHDGITFEKKLLLKTSAKNEPLKRYVLKIYELFEKDDIGDSYPSFHNTRSFIGFRTRVSFGRDMHCPSIFHNDCSIGQNSDQMEASIQIVQLVVKWFSYKSLRFY